MKILKTILALFISLTVTAQAETVMNSILFRHTNSENRKIYGIT